MAAAARFVDPGFSFSRARGAPLSKHLGGPGNRRFPRSHGTIREGLPRPDQHRTSATTGGPRTTVFGDDAYPDLWQKAAAVAFLEDNGEVLEYRDVDAAERLVIAVTTGEMEDIPDLARRSRTRRVARPPCPASWPRTPGPLTAPPARRPPQGPATVSCSSSQRAPVVSLTTATLGTASYCHRTRRTRLTPDFGQAFPSACAARRPAGGGGSQGRTRVRSGLPDFRSGSGRTPL